MMPHAVRCGASSRCLCLILLLAAGTLSAQARTVGDTAALEFFGFRAGAHLREVSARIGGLSGGRLRCASSRLDRRVADCRALLSHPDIGGEVELWLSAIDSIAAVLTLAANTPTEQLDGWRHSLERRYGRVGTQVQGSQRTMQWVRRGRMIRLTWRTQHSGKVASVSLVDGRVLDRWKAPRTRLRKEPRPEEPPPEKPRPSS